MVAGIPGTARTPFAGRIDGEHKLAVISAVAVAKAVTAASWEDCQSCRASILRAKLYRFGRLVAGYRSQVAERDETRMVGKHPLSRAVSHGIGRPQRRGFRGPKNAMRDEDELRIRR